MVNKFCGDIKLERIAVYSSIIERLNELIKIKEVTSKVKIPHPIENINNIVYVVRYGILDWVSGAYVRIMFSPSVTGVYRFTTAASSDKLNFNSEVRVELISTSSDISATNTIIVKMERFLSTWSILIDSFTDKK